MACALLIVIFRWSPTLTSASNVMLLPLVPAAVLLARRVVSDRKVVMTTVVVATRWLAPPLVVSNPSSVAAWAVVRPSKRASLNP